LDTRRSRTYSGVSRPSRHDFDTEIRLTDAKRAIGFSDNVTVLFGPTLTGTVVVGKPRCGNGRERSRFVRRVWPGGLDEQYSLLRGPTFYSPNSPLPANFFYLLGRIRARNFRFNPDGSFGDLSKTEYIPSSVAVVDAGYVCFRLSEKSPIFALDYRPKIATFIKRTRPGRRSTRFPKNKSALRDNIRIVYTYYAVADGEKKRARNARLHATTCRHTQIVTERPKTIYSTRGGRPRDLPSPLAPCILCTFVWRPQQPTNISLRRPRRVSRT